uniref:phosphoethanolamine N-methyltransferase 3-like isoform X5 n=1 Tax=Podarcis muralis TaxID=64176 RepID=UPI00109F6711|nr:phosphoethanolamine N-methyltransferase 3-like isoform X5 [Podarcis muralis]
MTQTGPGGVPKEAAETSPRLRMRRFWEEHSQNSSVQEMMLDSGAQQLTQEDTPEIIALLPCLKGQDVLELGAGIGRFTAALAKLAHHVTAVDFMESFLAHNRQENGHQPNVDFLQADVTSLQLPSQSFDLIFSNWLFMYLSDTEVSDVAQKMLLWLRPGGQLFFRESCFYQSGDQPRAFNPTLYRTPAEYNHLFTSAHQTCGDELYGFEIVMSRSVQTYIKELVCMLDLKQGQRVLDVGCGLGGSDFYMAKEFGVEVLGMDLSHNMVEMALERAQKETGSLVQFEIGNATRRTFPENTFDVVYSRDTVLHVPGKSALFAKFLSWLKPGGQLLISDYCCGPRPWSKAFTEYVRQRGYSLLTPWEYGQVLQEAGFRQVQALDYTERMLSALTQELQELERSRQQFVQEFSESEFESLASGWREKLQRCADGDQRWGVFYALKPQ